MSLLLSLIVLAAVQGPAEKNIVFVGAGGMKLKGILTMPASPSGKPVPAVLLLPGSGPTDQDGNQRPVIVSNLLKDISDSLAKSGIATLRFDKRATWAYQTIFPKTVAQQSEFFKWDNFVGDATAAYRFLGSQSEIDPKRVGIVGHSEGALIALQIGSDLADKTNPPAAIVTVGGTGRPMGPIIHEQISKALERQKVPATMRKSYMDYVEKATQQITANATIPPNAPPGLDRLFTPSAALLLQSYFRIDPTALARKYPGPVLVVNGAKDTQVSATEDAPLLKAALEERKGRVVEMMIVPNASHHLKSTSGGNDDAVQGPIVPEAASKLTEFLKNQLHP